MNIQPSGNLTLAEWVAALEICKKRFLDMGEKGALDRAIGIPGFNPKKF